MTDALEKARNHFIRRWGEMGATWGISRTMAEMHALLFISGEPLCTDDIMEQLQISRGNASMNLRQLVNWGLVKRMHVRGDRKDYFYSDLDAWEMFETIVRERRRREVEPIIETIDRCRQELAVQMSSVTEERKTEARSCDQRLEDMLEFIHTMNRMLDMVMSVGRNRLESLADTLISMTPSQQATGDRTG